MTDTLDRIIRCLIRRRCEHEQEACVGHEILGVTMAWSGRPVVEHRWTMRCEACGRTRTSRGYLPRELRNDPLDTDGWPLNPDGSRMEIAKHD